jgi:hypothetical protein
MAWFLRRRADVHAVPSGMVSGVAVMLCTVFCAVVTARRCATFALVMIVRVCAAGVWAQVWCRRGLHELVLRRGLRLWQVQSSRCVHRRRRSSAWLSLMPCLSTSMPPCLPSYLLYLRASLTPLGVFELLLQDTLRASAVLLAGASAGGFVVARACSLRTLLLQASTLHASLRPRLPRSCVCVCRCVCVRAYVCARVCARARVRL